MESQASKTNNIPLWKRAVNFVLAGAMMLSLLGVAAPQAAQASQPVGDVIYNYPYVPVPETTPTSPKDIDWNYTRDHNDPNVTGYSGTLKRPLQGYEQAYTEALSQKYNGDATPNHVVPSEDPVTEGTIAFYGYGVMPYMDYIFSSITPSASRGLSFLMHPINMNFHTLSETGYLFNGQMSKEGADTYYTGYAVILSCANDAGMQENDTTAPNTAALRVYYIDHELWNTENFKPGNTSNTRTLIATIKTGINNLDSTAYRTSVEVDPATRAFKVFVDGVCWVSVDAASVTGGSKGPTGFGFYTGYYAHDCNILTRIRYEYISIITTSGAEVKPVPATSEVKFLEQGTNQELRVPETEVSYVGQGYRIVQPQKITYQGDVYYLVSNSRNVSTKSDIRLAYQANDADNTTTLYYVKPATLTTKAPEKDARVNGGDWSRGTTDTPVSVVAGDSIDYDITAYHPVSGGIAMLRQGNSGSTGDTAWLGQQGTYTLANGTSGTSVVQKRYINSVSFENLSSSPAYDPMVANSAVTSFLTDNNSTWEGQPIVAAWDATEPDLSLNPDGLSVRVIAWVTLSSGSGSGFYDLHIGGYGGVYLSSSTSSSYLFYNFTSMTAFDSKNLHTETAVNMFYMFDYCLNLSDIDLSYFDTSNVTNMVYMFCSCQSLSSLDLRNFNTSKVTAMTYMFGDCPKLSSLNVSSFNTSNVTNMSYMFGGPVNYYPNNAYNSLTSLDLSNFDTSNVISMAYMFGGSQKLASLNVSSFNTSNVTDMSYMFGGCYALKALNLRNFDTSLVSNSSHMFQNCRALTSLDLSSFDTEWIPDMSYMFNSCYALQTIDLGSFNTARVTDMSYMFQNCYALQTVDCSSFNTANVTTMTYMFQNCRAFQSLSLNTFDVSKVTTFVFMFGGCSALESLDLSYWQLGVLNSAAGQMFLSCPNLTALHLESAPLDQLTGTRANALFSPGNSTEVFVGTAAAQTWLTTGTPAGLPATATLVSPPTDPQPQPQIADWKPNVKDWKDNLSDWSENLVEPAKQNGSSAGQTIITDTIPDGLTIDESSITGTDSATPLDNTITWQRSGQTITWSVPDDMLPADVSVKVTVNTGLATDTTFDNTAYVGQTATNTTFHKLKAGWGVTEQYRIYDGGTNATQLDDDVTTDVAAGDAYNIQGPTTSLYGYTYYGYERIGIDSTIQTGVPTPAFDDGSTPLHSSDFGATNHETIILYYKKTATTVTIHYVDQDGNEIASPTVAGVNSNTDYYLLNSYFDPIDVSGITYTYYNYAANADKSVKDQGMPAPALTLGATPVYPDGSVPTFTAAQMTGDKDVTLYFTTQKAVTVHYVEKGNPAHILHPDATYFVPATFDAGTAVINTLTDPVISKIYTYTSSYSLDSGVNLSSGSPGTVTAPADITLYYSTGYSVTEKYHTSETTPTVLAPDQSFNKAGGDPFYSQDTPGENPPASISGYNYIGYKFGNDSNPLQEGYPPLLIPLIPAVYQDENIIYVYEKSKLNVTYVDGHDGSTITTESVGYGDDATFPAPAPTHPGYHFTGWDSDGKNITVDTTITAQYAPDTDTPYTVKHYLVDAFGIATPACPDEHKTGTTDTTATATPKTFSGYTHDPGYPGTISEGVIAGDGSLVLVLYYTQDQLNVTYVDGHDGSTITTESVGYGDDATFPAPAPTHPGYHFTGWDSDGKNITEDTTITAQYAPDTDTPYTVEHYLVDRSGNAVLQSSDTEHKTGTTDTTATATPKSYSGYSYTAGYDKDGNKEIASGLIAGDGSLVLKLYYVQDALTVTYVDHDGSLITTQTVGYGDDATPPTDPTRPGYHFKGWDKDGKNITEDTTITAEYEPLTDTPYKTEYYWVDADGNATLHENVPGQGTTDSTVNADVKSYTGYTYSPAYPGTVNSGTIAADGSLVLKLYYTVVEPQKEPVYTVQVRYHLWTANGEVIVTDTIPGNWKPGDSVNPTGILNAHKPYGFGTGVPVGANWKVSTDSDTVFDIYYPDTPPVINVENDVIYVRKPVELTLEDILRIAGVTITDAEENIPLSKLKEMGYSSIKWSVVNYPSGDGYIITLQVTDTPGLTSDIQSIVIFVLDEPETIRKPKPGELPPSDYTPKGTEWGIDNNGEWVIYIPTATPKTPAAIPKALASSGLPKTGDSIALTSPVVLAAAGAALLFGERRRRRHTNLGG